jgi:DNA-binding transcriptional regulator YiaG
MYTNRDLPLTASPSDNAHADAEDLRFLLKAANLSQRSAANYLNVDERTMRSWCAGDGRPPAAILRALEFRAAYPAGLMRMIEANERKISAIKEGRISGLDDGSGHESKRNLIAELEQLQKRNEEHRALLRLDQAFHSRQETILGMNEQWLPRGSGLPTEDSLNEFDAADQEFRAAQAECDRITKDIRAGKR